MDYSVKGAKMPLEKIVAIVPMRHESKRVPGKNYREIAGKPLYHYILSSLLMCPEISQIVVDTDSPLICDGIKNTFSEIYLLERPEHLRADTVPTNEILIFDTAEVSADLYLQTHSTNPLLEPSTISRAIQTFRSKYPTFDSAFGVTRLHTRLWNSLGCAVNHNPSILLRTQDLPPIYEENSCLYLFTRETLLFKRNRIGDRPMMIEIDRQEAIDIDEEIDFTIAELLINQKKKNEIR
jgi:CMP-N-acetylneuraminic acid synthetase